jgi:hypothetical protein
VEPVRHVAARPTVGVGQVPRLRGRTPPGEERNTCSRVFAHPARGAGELAMRLGTLDGGSPPRAQLGRA